VTTHSFCIIRKTPCQEKYFINECSLKEPGSIAYSFEELPSIKPLDRLIFLSIVSLLDAMEQDHVSG